MQSYMKYFTFNVAVTFKSNLRDFYNFSNSTGL